MKKHFLFVIIICGLLLGSCNTYYLSTQSMLEQFVNTHKEKKITLLLAPPFVVIPFAVDGNSLKKITVLDKKNKEHTFRVTHRTGIRITQKDGTKTTFYFNTLLLKDSTITGNKTHFFNARIKPIRFADISKIALQR